MYKLVDVIILSYCPNKTYFDVNVNCINSLLISEPEIEFKITIIESFSDFANLNYRYDFPNLKIITPKEPFNFNKFLNIALQSSSTEWIVFTNNDVTFHVGWLAEMFNVKKINNKIQSFCPFDQTSPYLSLQNYSHKQYHIGYRVPIEFVGWCFVIERAVFEIIGSFDENFDLYFQDNDFAMTLKKHHIVHAMVPNSFVEHLGGYTTKQSDASKSKKYAEDKIKFLSKWKKGAILTRIISLLKRNR